MAMGETSLRREERVGLIVAGVLHAALLAVLLIQPSTRETIEPVERMTVNLATDVGMAATAPDPVAESRASVAPTLDPAMSPAPEPERPIEQPVERPQVQSPIPAPSAAPSRPRERASAPSRNAEPAPRRRAEPARQPAASAPPKSSGGSRIGDNFLDGAGDSTRTEDTRIPASQIGASAKASIVQAIARQIKPHWNAPSGVDAEELVTILAFRLDESGKLIGQPRVMSQSGVTDSNRPQVGLHAERAIRAVQLAAPFDLPPEYYNAWKNVSGARFDRNLSR